MSAPAKRARKILQALQVGGISVSGISRSSSWRGQRVQVQTGQRSKRRQVTMGQEVPLLHKHGLAAVGAGEASPVSFMYRSVALRLRLRSSADPK